MNLFAIQVAHGDPKAVRKFVGTVMRSKSHAEAQAKLELSRTTYYRLLKKIREEGTSV